MFVCVRGSTIFNGSSWVHSDNYIATKVQSCITSLFLLCAVLVIPIKVCSFPVHVCLSVLVCQDACKLRPWIDIWCSLQLLTLLWCKVSPRICGLLTYWTASSWRSFCHHVTAMAFGIHANTCFYVGSGSLGSLCFHDKHLSHWANS